MRRLIILLALAACRRETGTAFDALAARTELREAVPVARVELVPAEGTLRPGSTLHLTALLYAPDGSFTRAPVAWESSSENAAVVEGVVTAKPVPGLSFVTITARAGGQEASSTLVVDPNAPAIERVEIYADPGPMRATTARAAVARAVDERGASLAPVFSWWSSDPSIATVNEHGRIRARRAGDVVIHAAAGGKIADLPIHVTEVLAER